MSTPDWNRRAQLINALAQHHIEDGTVADEWDVLRQLADRWERCWRRAGAWTVRVLLTRKHRVRRRAARIRRGVGAER